MPDAQVFPSPCGHAQIGLHDGAGLRRTPEDESRWMRRHYLPNSCFMAASGFANGQASRVECRREGCKVFWLVRHGPALSGLAIEDDDAGLADVASDDIRRRLGGWAAIGGHDARPLGAYDCLRACALRRSGPGNSSSIERKRTDDQDDGGPQAQSRDGLSVRAVTWTAIQITAPRSHGTNHSKHTLKRQSRAKRGKPGPSDARLRRWPGSPRFARDDGFYTNSLSDTFFLAQ